MNPSISDRIRRAEQLARAEGLDLMARAGRAAADFIAARHGPETHVLALAGPGNNGGDALVAATWLCRWGYEIQVVMLSEPAALPSDAAQAYAGWRAAGGVEDRALPLKAPQVVIDGLFGIGLNRRLAAQWQAAVDAVNAWQAPVLALDIPSGIAADTGAALGQPLQARWTLAFIAPTPGLALGAGAAAAGEVHLDTLELAPDWLSRAFDAPLG
ncbi:NAD(P)H-hydrate epimerase [Bordetella genomosp. 1]|uniref:NAD(P)H-hydrate epimerase n=1 Tax=Bordetella genomosp. 1 TaxID=1395607 RepID=A0ABX4F3N9_9BORD|nr:NAD(P)H-hydrate epimerase [Bordetella genomosp. 1]OZI65689.1 NAD(P)H-hydrate epimerase [Bordetella genomosp. 1]